MTLHDEARSAWEARRWQAHRPEPPVELIRPIEAVAFLLALPLVVVFVAFFLALSPT